MSTKTKFVYICQKCGAQYPKWAGHCSDCGTWNSLVEDVVVKTNPRFSGYLATTTETISLLADVSTDTKTRLPTEIEELDRVLGGGLVIGSTVLIGGDPGIGKSTLLLQALCNFGKSLKVLYITGEESLQQIAMRARRLELPEDRLLLLAETQVEKIINIAMQEKPDIIAIDSIQTMYTEAIPSAPGGVGQIRECTAQLVRYAKQSKTALFVVGHVTKEGTLAGPKVLEHMVDCVLYFEGDDESHLTNPRRVTAGLDPNRLSILLAVLHRHGGIPTYNQDVFINIVGGMRIAETALDLPILLAVLSSIRNRPLDQGLVVFGEVGLAGEIRPVQSGQERLKTAIKHGFKKAIIPNANAPKKPLPGIEIIAVKSLTEALQAAR